MKAKTDIREAVKHLSDRLKNDRIIVNWKDRKAFDAILDHFSFVSEDDLDVVYLRRCLTYIACQVISLRLGEEHEINLQSLVYKLQEVLKADSRLYTDNLGTDMIAHQILNSKPVMDQKDFNDSLDDLITDVIRYETRNGFQRISN